MVKKAEGTPQDSLLTSNPESGVWAKWGKFSVDGWIFFMSSHAPNISPQPKHRGGGKHRGLSLLHDTKEPTNQTPVLLLDPDTNHRSDEASFSDQGVSVPFFAHPPPQNAHFLPIFVRFCALFARPSQHTPPPLLSSIAQPGFRGCTEARLWPTQPHRPPSHPTPTSRATTPAGDRQGRAWGPAMAGVVGVV